MGNLRETNRKKFIKPLIDSETGEQVIRCLTKGDIYFGEDTRSYDEWVDENEDGGLPTPIYYLEGWKPDAEGQGYWYYSQVSECALFKEHHDDALDKFNLKFGNYFYEEKEINTYQVIKVLENALAYYRVRGHSDNFSEAKDETESEETNQVEVGSEGDNLKSISVEIKYNSAETVTVDDVVIAFNNYAKNKYKKILYTIFQIGETNG